MQTNDFMKRKLLENNNVSHFMSYMKDKGGAYIAGGALTCIATGRHDQIEDYDVYFPTLEACVEGIRYMKSENPHVAFISDKSVTYVMKDSVKIQFVYNDFYPKAEDIFKHFDFTINMAAYDCRDGNIYTHENFWMHNAQRYLGVNMGTKFPIITNLRVDKYKQRGYKISRNERLKISLAIASLNITTWEEAKAQIGNTYGFTLADFKDVEGSEFSIEKLVERIEAVNDGQEMPMQEQYLYPHDCLDFVIMGKPVEVVEINGEEFYVDTYASECDYNLDKLIEDGTLEKKVISNESILSADYYVIAEDKLMDGGVYKERWSTTTLYQKDKLLKNQKGNVVYKVSFEEKNIKDFGNDTLSVSECTIIKKVCRSEDVLKFQDNQAVEYKPNAKMKGDSCSKDGWAFKENAQSLQGEISQIKKMREEHLEKYVVISNKNPRHARTEFSGYIIEGGEDITAYEVLLFADSFNLCFGGNCTVKENGTFSGSYHTD